MEIITINRRLTLIKLLLLVLFFLPLKTSAIEPLTEGQGYMLVVLNVEQGYIPDFVTITEDGAFGDTVRMESLAVNANFRLFAVDAGTYSWERLYFTKRHYIDLEDKEYKIKVEPGTVSYAGHLSLYSEMNASQSEFLGGARLHYNNRSSRALYYMEYKYPELLKQYPLIYTGDKNDDFLQYVTSLEGADVKN